MPIHGRHVQLVPALTLLVVSPLIGEFLLGNIAIDMIWLLPLLALLYGTGALIVREAALRLGAGWPGIFILGLAYGVIEEGFVTQSLFDPAYLGLRLLDSGYLPALGMGAWWTVFVLVIHMIWSMAAAIALAEALWPKQAGALWLSVPGLAATTLLFLAGCAAVAVASGARLVASAGQLIAVATVVAALIGAAWRIGRRRAASVEPATRAPSPQVAGVTAFLLLSSFMLTTWTMTSVRPALNVGAMIGLLAALGLLVRRWARAAGWSPRHRLALTAGALMTYAWWSLTLPAMVTMSTRVVDTGGNLVFLAIAVILLSLAWRRLAGVRGRGCGRAHPAVT